MQCLVTGGCGFIGSHLVERLLQLGHSVRVLDDLSTGQRRNLPSAHDHLEFHEGSILDPLFLDRLLEGCDVVYHLAALPSVQRSLEDPLATHEVGVTGTLRLLLAAKHAKVERFVFASSSSVYGDRVGVRRHESMPTLPLSPYAVSKLAAEHYCACFSKSNWVETVCLRLFNVFGPRQRLGSPYSAVIPRFIRALLAEERPVVFGDGRQSRDFTFVDNVVDAFVAAGAAPGVAGKVFNVGMGKHTCLRVLLRLLGRILGVQPKPTFESARSGDVRHSRADITLAQTELHYTPSVDLLEGLNRTVRYVREEVLQS